MGQVPTYPIPMNYEYSSTLIKFITFIKNGTSITKDIEQDKVSNDITKSLWVNEIDQNGVLKEVIQVSLHLNDNVKDAHIKGC